MARNEKAALSYAEIAAREENPYKMTVDQQLTALRRANDEEKWGLIETDFERLAATAPAWPKGGYACRSFRIRFGEGAEGVTKTFEAHCARIQQVFGRDQYWRWEFLELELLQSDEIERYGKPVEHLRLLNGNHTHHAVIEWIVADLDTHREHESVAAVRDSQSLADELLVITWMFPDMIRFIGNYYYGLFAAGYEVNLPELDEAWQRVVIVGFGYQLFVHAYDRSSGISNYLVPHLRKSPALGA